MLDGLPLDPHAQRHEGNGQSDEVKEREGKDVQDQLARRAGDPAPLADDRQGADEGKGEVACPEGLEQAEHRRAGALRVDRDPHHNGRNQGEQHGGKCRKERLRQSVKEHVVAGKTYAAARLFEDAAKQSRCAAEEAKEPPLGPADALADHDAPLMRLLVVEGGRLAKGDMPPVGDAREGELGVLGQGGVVPALGEQIGAQDVAGACDVGGQAEPGARAVELHGTAVEVDAVGRGDGVAAEVLDVAVADGDVGAGVKGLIDLGKVVGVEEVVGVKDDVALHEINAEVAVDAREKVFQRIAFSGFGRVVTFVDDRPFCAGDGGGVVGAVVGYDKDFYPRHVVVLLPNAVEKMADDNLLVAGGDDDAVGVEAVGGGVGLGLAEKADDGVDGLIEHEHRDQRGHDGGELVEHLHVVGSFLHIPCGFGGLMDAFGRPA